MIVGVGVDITKVARFAEWAQKPRNQLIKVLSSHEIDYCLESPQRAPERFAAHWAAKEAFYKALGASLPLLQVCRAIEVRKHTLLVDWDLLGLPPRTAYLSMAHERDTAVAFVVLEQPKS